MPKQEKHIKVNINASAKVLQRQLLKYLVSVEHKIDGRSRDKFWNVFLKSNKPKLLETYEALKTQIGAQRPNTLKVTFENVKPSARKDYLINVVLYTDVQQAKGQKPWNGLYLMFPSDPNRQYEVKAPKIFPQSIVKRVVRIDKTKQEARLFKLGIKILLTDGNFENLYDKLTSGETLYRPNFLFMKSLSLNIKI